MSDASLIGLVQNAALLLAAAFIFDAAVIRGQTGQTFYGRIIAGFAVGAIGIAVMLTPWTFRPGIVFDLRSVLIATSGLFFGLLPTAIAMAMTATFRLYQGGAGAWTGVAVIIASGLIGIVWRRFRRRGPAEISWGELYLFGLVVHAAMLATLLTLPWETVPGVLAHIGLPILLIYPVGTALLGRLMVNRFEYEHQIRLLSESEERYRDLFEKNHAVMLIIDPDGGPIVDANGAAVAYYGWTRDELLRKKISDINTLPPSEVQAEMDRARIEKRRHFLFRHRLAEGSVRDVEVFSGPISLEGRRLLYSIIHDITDSRRIEQEMAVIAEIGRVIGSTLDIDEVYERFAAVTRQLISFDSLVVNLKKEREDTLEIAYVSGVDIAGRRAGDSMSTRGTLTEAIMGTRTGAIVQSDRGEELASRFPALIASVRAGIHSVMAVPLISRDRVIGTLMVRSTKPNAYTERDLRLAERVGEQIAGAIANARLYRELREAQESLKESEERLQRARKMEALGTLAGGVAHDLNNVLGVIVGYSEMLLDEIDAASPSGQDVMKIMEGGQRAAAIIQDLLTLARRGVQNRQVVNLNTTIMDCQKTPEFEKALSSNPRIRIRTDLEPNLLNISASPVHLGKTLINLVANASEAMPDGGTVTITTRNRYVDRPIQGYDQIREGDYAVLSVSDTGEGIAANDLARIFEPFYTKKVMGRSGTGLGLAVVWGTVRDHDGYIDVRSKEGEGSTFTLYFPVTRDGVSGDEISVPVTDYTGNGETILVVDDVREQRELAVRMLTKLCYRVDSVSGGEAAVEYVKSHDRIDLIVLDMVMDPGIDGLETYRQILEIRPGQKAIIVSGFSETERVSQARALGAGAYVRKPYVMERLGLAVRNELAGTRDHSGSIAADGEQGI